MKKILSVLILTAVILSVGCKQKEEQAASAPATGAPKTLHIYCWSNYFAPKFIADFEEKMKVKVELNYFSSNEELLAKLQAGARGYDLIVPSGYTIKPLKELKLILPLGKIEWPELKNLVSYAKAPKADPNHEYAIPYLMGLTGFAINKQKIKATNVDSLSWLFDHPELKGQIAMQDDAPVVVGTALKYLGYSYNESSDEALAKAKALLSKQKKLLKTYTADAIPLMDSGEVAITQAYSGDVLQVKRRNPNIEFVIPKEGGEYYIDFLAIPTGAQNIDLAKEFMKFSLDSKMAAIQTLHLFYTPVVDIKGLPGIDVLIKNPVIFPSEETLKHFEMSEDNPDRLEKIQKIWTELKSS